MTRKNDFDRLLTDALAPVAHAAPLPADLRRVPRSWIGDPVGAPLRMLAVATVAVVATLAAVVGFTALRDGLSLSSVGGPSESAAVASLVPIDEDEAAATRRADELISTSLTAWEWVLVSNAQEEAVETCMQELGWDFELGTHDLNDESLPGALTTLQQWTFADLASAEAEGYGLGRHAAEIAAVAQASGLLERLAEEGSHELRILDVLEMNPADAARFELEYFGREDERVEITEHDGSHSGLSGGGCLGRGMRAVWGDIATWMWLRDARDTIEPEVWAAVLADPAVGSGLELWRECARANGLELTDPAAAVASARAAANAGDVGQERRIATAHAECTAASGLDRAVSAAFLAATNALLPAYEADLLALRALKGETLTRATAILAPGN